MFVAVGSCIVCRVMGGAVFLAPGACCCGGGRSSASSSSLSSVEVSDTTIYEPEIRALLEIAPQLGARSA